MITLTNGLENSDENNFIESDENEKETMDFVSENMEMLQTNIEYTAEIQKLLPDISFEIPQIPNGIIELARSVKETTKAESGWAPVLSELNGMMQSSVFKTITETLNQYRPSNEILTAIKIANQIDFTPMFNAFEVISSFSEYCVKPVLDFCQSALFDWIGDICISGIQKIYDEFPDFEYGIKKVRQIEDVYMATLADCNWFPYAGRNADVGLYIEIQDIIDTSRGKSARRQSRVDKAILAYYNDKEIMKVKHSLNQTTLEPHIKRMIKEALDAHLQGRYMLTISCLTSLWETLILSKVGRSGRFKQHVVGCAFGYLTENNDCSDTFSEYYNNEIITDVNEPEDKVEGVPNRNGVLHGKHNKYPNEKESLNAILITDFILHLKPQTVSDEQITMWQNQRKKGRKNAER